MKLILALLPLFAAAYSCKSVGRQSVQQQQVDSGFLIIRSGESPKGVVYLTGGYGETASDIHKEAASLIDTLSTGGYVVVLLETGSLRIVFDTTAVGLIENAVHKSYGKYPQLNDLPAFIGGFSIGGTYAISYVQKQFSGHQLSNLKGVFAVDPPLDPLRMAASCRRRLRENPNTPYSGEYKMILNSLERQFGSGNFDAGGLAAYAPFIEDDSIKYLPGLLSSFPVRIYCEPAINWQLQERGRDLYDLNILDASGLVNYLRLKGNSNATLVTKTNTGIRANGNRNPHSWSIVPAGDLLQWLNNSGNNE